MSDFKRKRQTASDWFTQNLDDETTDEIDYVLTQDWGVVDASVGETVWTKVRD